MKSTMTSLVFTTALMTAPLTAWSGNVYHPADVEPCLNGNVSSSGLFPTQALEDEYNTLVATLKRDPCIIGVITAPQAFPTRAMEEEFHALARQAKNRC